MQKGVGRQARSTDAADKFHPEDQKQRDRDIDTSID
jgi:hypothetical protein